MEVISGHHRVPKKWGHEIWIVNNEHYCGKFLGLNKGYRCSMHYHEIKEEDFYILEGKVLMELAGESAIMRKGQSIHIKPRQKHRFTGLEKSVILEFSTHHEDSDSYRSEIGGKVDLEELEIT